MAIDVVRAIRVTDEQIVRDGRIPASFGFTVDDLFAVLVGLSDFAVRGSGPEWHLSILSGAGQNAKWVRLPLGPVLTREVYERSAAAPLSLAELGCRIEGGPIRGIDQIWVFRDAFYVTQRPPLPSESEEVALRIKSLHYQADESLKRLREQVSNFEAIENVSSDLRSRRAIPDDVKILVWSRDGGTCVRCSSSTELHFDHIIPFSRGGSDTAENIQLLCRSCNLAKGSRLA
ncbi:MAG TPA: HNH endonuclease [Terriglobales bacterium]|nr:HNH endonuclease [Terriglobales bacterium]